MNQSIYSVRSHGLCDNKYDTFEVCGMGSSMVRIRILVVKAAIERKIYSAQ